MKRTLITMLVGGLLASATAAAHDGANDFDGPHLYQRQLERNVTIRERESRIGQWIQRSVQDGRIGRWQARQLYRELEYVRHKAAPFGADGRMDWREFAELNADLDRLAEQVRAEGWTVHRWDSGHYQPGYAY